MALLAEIKALIKEYDQANRFNQDPLSLHLFAVEWKKTGLPLRLISDYLVSDTWCPYAALNFHKEGITPEDACVLYDGSTIGHWYSNGEMSIFDAKQALQAFLDY